MDEFNDNEISKLLRLKRYEQPPPGYFENFLHEFHRRQRDELLRQPLWRVCIDRARNFALSFNLSTLTSYPSGITRGHTGVQHAVASKHYGKRPNSPQRYATLRARQRACEL
jgi:hypothetical protein